MVIVSFTAPLAAAIVVIVFDLYWLFRLGYLTLFLILASCRLSIERRTDWMGRVQALESPGPSDDGPARTLPSRVSQWIHRRAVAALAASGSRPPPWQSIHHLVIIPIAKESQDVVEPGIESLAHQPFPSTQILVVLAVEARASEAIHAGARQIQRRYRDRFLDLMIVTHPDGLPGEARVKGANASYAAHAAARVFTAHRIPFDQVIASCFDADTVVGPDYIACLTYHFLISPDRAQASFQPIPVYHNNIWDVPAFARVLDIGASFMQLAEATDPDALVTFSSHSMSFQALVEVGYWPVDMISDDSAIFWKAYIHYDGRYRVVPMYVTLSMDVAAAATWWGTVTNVYRQKRRWAWGVENFPLVMRAFLRARRIRRSAKLVHGIKMFEGHVLWATGAFLLTIGWFPPLFAGRDFSNTVLYYSAPRITSIIFHLASLSFLTSILLSLALVPKPPRRWPLLTRLALAFEWLLVPVIFMGLSALPALDAQTRLMLGRRLEFWVTEKSRRPSSRRPV